MRTLLQNDVWRYGFTTGFTFALLCVLTIVIGTVVVKSMIKTWKSSKQSKERRAYLEALQKQRSEEHFADYFKRVEQDA